LFQFYANFVASLSVVTISERLPKVSNHRSIEEK